MRRAYERLGAGLIGLYIVLALISWSTTRSLRRHAARHRHEALHDGLTGLPNRAAFRARAETALEAATRGGPGGATELVSIYIYNQSFAAFQLGYGAAVAVIVLIIALVLGIAYVKAMKVEI